MYYYVYVLRSEKDGDFYTGYTKDLKLRFEQHKKGLVESTKNRQPLKADSELGRLDMYSKYILNIDLFISMHVIKEATQSSKIEGTQTNVDEAWLF